MVLSRILGGIGRAMMSAGVLILLFVAYQLWGTGLQTSQAQDRLAKTFDEQLQQVQRDAGATTTAAPAPVADDEAAAPPAPLSLSDLAKDPRVQALVKDKVYQWGEPIGKITIPKIGVDFWIVEGVELSLLDEAPGHFPNTPFPGQPGNAALAGHRTTFKAPFNRIDELSAGDKITVETLQGKFTYEVLPQAGGVGHYIVAPDGVQILADKGDNRLTLMACHPKYSAAQRIVVEAKLVDNPAEKTKPSKKPEGYTDAAAINQLGQEQRTELGDLAQLANGDDSARGPAIAFSLGAALVWLVVAIIGWIWRKAKWPAYAVGLPFFGILLWHAFDSINRALPAAF